MPIFFRCSVTSICLLKTPRWWQASVGPWTLAWIVLKTIRLTISLDYQSLPLGTSIILWFWIHLKFLYNARLSDDFRSQFPHFQQVWIQVCSFFKTSRFTIDKAGLSVATKETGMGCSELSCSSYMSLCVTPPQTSWQAPLGEEDVEILRVVSKLVILEWSKPLALIISSSWDLRRGSCQTTN